MSRDASRGDGLARVHLQWFAPEDEGRTEEPSEYKIRKAREEGRVAKSQDLVGSVGLLVTTVTVIILAPFFLSTLRDMLAWFITVSVELDISRDASIVAGAFFSYFAKLASPVALVAMVAALFSNLLQVGFLFTTKPIKPDFKKIVPRLGQYFKRTLFSLEGFYNLGKSLVKVAAIGIIGYANVSSRLSDLLRMQQATVWSSFSLVAGIASAIVLETAILLLAFAVPDYLFQRRQYRKQLKMTKQEVKEEHKMFEGDPLVKARLRERMRELLARNMAVNVPKADVVITNPTHYAVALEWRRDEMAAPMVSAKGMDEMARRIKAIAKESGVPLVENRPLARALYAEVEIGDAIPDKYYQAIAAVLAHVAATDAKAAEKYGAAQEA